MSESKVKEEMIEAHDALDGGVYIVMVFENGALNRHAVFSTMEKAKNWMDSHPGNISCLCAPFVIDNPEYGNIPKNEMQ